MRARAAAVVVAFGLLASVTVGQAGAEQMAGADGTSAQRLAGAPAEAAALLATDQLAPGGPAQWWLPWLMGGAGSNYVGPGGWRSFTPIYPPFGPYPSVQTAAFFGATNSPFDPFTTQLLALATLGSSVTGPNSPFGTGPLGTLAQSGLAPLLTFNLSALQALGLGTIGTNALGQPTFTIGTQTFTLSGGQTPFNTTLATLLNLPITGPLPVFGPGVALGSLVP